MLRDFRGGKAQRRYEGGDEIRGGGASTACWCCAEDTPAEDIIVAISGCIVALYQRHEPSDLRRRLRTRTRELQRKIAFGRYNIYPARILGREGKIVKKNKRKREMQSAARYASPPFSWHAVMARFQMLHRGKKKLLPSEPRPLQLWRHRNLGKISLLSGLKARETLAASRSLQQCLVIAIVICRIHSSCASFALHFASRRTRVQRMYERCAIIYSIRLFD